MKKFLTLFVALLCAVTIVGCGKTEKKEEGEKAAKYSYVSTSSSVKEKATVSFKLDSSDYKYSEEEEDLIVETEHSKAGVIMGKDFNIQIDYKSYDIGSNWDKFKASIKSTDDRYKSFIYNDVKGLRIYHSGVITYCFPATKNTYVVFTVLPSDSYKENYKTLLDSKDLDSLFQTMKIKVTGVE